jgi:hypothetical protein
MSLLRFAPFAIACAMIVACSATTSDEEMGETESDIRSRWQPVSVTAPNGVGTYDGVAGERCSGGLKPGSKQLGSMLDGRFVSEITRWDGYACRANTANRRQLSVHAVGRALDLFTRKGDPVANYLITNSNVLGVQMVIWNRTVWRITASGARSKAYTGPNPHTDHVHVELTREAAKDGPGTPQEEVAETTTPTQPDAGTTAGTTPDDDEEDEY